MAPYLSVDSIAFHLNASFATEALDNYDASGNLAAFVMDALGALDIVVDSPLEYHRNFSLDFPFDELEALAVDHTLIGLDVAAVALALVAVHFLTMRAFVPNAMFAVDDTAASCQQSFLELAQALWEIENHRDHHDQSIVDVHAKN